MYDTTLTLANHCPKLKKLNVCFCFLMTDNSIVALANNCPDLQELYLSWCYNLTDKSAIAIANCCPNLKILHMSNCYLCTNASIMALTQGCSQLQDLRLHDWPNLNDNTIETVVTSFPRLKNLDLDVFELDKNAIFREPDIQIKNQRRFFISPFPSNKRTIVRTAYGCPISVNFKQKRLGLSGILSISSKICAFLSLSCLCASTLRHHRLNGGFFVLVGVQQDNGNDKHEDCVGPRQKYSIKLVFCGHKCVKGLFHREGNGKG